MKRSLFIVTILVFSFYALQAQISSPVANATDVTQYPVFSETDDIFIFCTSDSLAEVATLTASTELEGTKTWLWEKYNETSGSFELYYQESADAASSQINDLANGCYRITITQGATTVVDRAWVFNNWMYAGGEVKVSDCEHFVITGEMNSAVLTYYDLSSNAPVFVNKDVQVEWLEDGNRIASVLNLEVYDPPTKNTNYTLRVYDKFDCDAQADVTYESIVTKAIFTADPMNGEAPLDVTFSNNSENGTPGYYEWFFYRDLNAIKMDSEGAEQPVDSIMLVAYDDAPVYTYENSGTYMVRLVSKHLSDSLTCVDTAYLEDYIEVDTSFIAVPNVFTPNGDGTNDEFVVQFWSMQSIEISIFNRWGKRVHYWESGDVRGFEGSYTESVWDGRIMGGRYASPGVYYYDVTGRGRDGEKRKKHGFVHLFRNKD
ncbi:gliding motility-associated C-terminal domain-containing protein [uncultured Draconibacterium sp.]|uniref:T9SS type B sorting domain-containing protein n=1 Tax=uncultured Draconibacterium sp. TaxID=1573823 RepID=UPI002AA7B2AF|nr:gliding motility-associated C-terminal domain-containing protein [uncultured Draconibacterium sp.]